MIFNRTKNAKRNSFWGLINRIIGLLIPFATRTVLIKALGSEYLGLSSLFTSILTVLNLSELGIGSAIVYNMYKPIADDDIDTISALLNLYKKIYRIIGICVLVIGIGIIPFLGAFIKGDVPQDVNIYVLYFIYLSNTCLSYWLFAHHTSILHAYQRDDIISKTALVFNILMHSLQIFLILIFRNYYCYVIVIPCTTLFTNISNYYFSKSIFPFLKCEGQLDKSKKKDIGKRVLGLSITNISAVSRNALDSIIISAFLGLNAVAMYNNYFYIMNAVSSVLLVFISSIGAGIGNAVATETTEENYKKLRFLNFMYMSLVGLCALFLLNIYQPFMKLWVGEELMLNEYIMVLFVLYFYIGHSGNVIVKFFDARGLWWKAKWRGIIETIMNLTLNLLLGYYFGILGIIVATIISAATVSIPLLCFYTFRYYFKSSPRKYLIDFIVLSFVITLAGVTSYLICNAISLPSGLGYSILYIIVRVLVTLVSFLCAFLCLWRHPLFIETKEFIFSQFRKNN